MNGGEDATDACLQRDGAARGCPHGIPASAERIRRHVMHCPGPGSLCQELRRELEDNYGNTIPCLVLYYAGLDGTTRGMRCPCDCGRAGTRAVQNAPVTDRLPQRERQASEPSAAECLPARLVKRALDVALSAVGLLFGGPLALAAALLVRMESKGPLFYAQERCGRHDGRFRLWKVRTMVPRAEARTGPVWAGPGDPRCTRIGAVLRRTGIDELPQLWNVLKGDMSLVGPRPERPHFVRHFRRVLPDYAARHRVKPGLTGLAQVNGWRGHTCVRKRLEYDLRYVRNWSLGLDLKLIALTAFHLISGSDGSARPPE